MTRLKTFVMIFVFLLAANCSLWADTTPEEEQVITLTRQCVDNLKELAEQCYEENDYWLAEESYALITSIAQNKDETVKRIEDGRYELYNNIPNYLPQKSIDDYNQAENCHKAGLKLLKDGKYQAASESLKNALSFYSFFPEVLVELGGCHEKLKNPQQAIQNYRLAVKYFRLQSHRSKEQNKLLDDALKAIDRLDALGKQFLKCQNDYTSNLINHAKKCLTKGYDGVASQALVQTMKVDAAHPKAQELLAVIEQGLSQTNISEIYTTSLFNGRDLTGWRPMKLLRVENRSIIAEAPPKCEASLIWAGKVPDSFSFYTTFFIEPGTRPNVGFYYGYTRSKDYDCSNIHDISNYLIPGMNCAEYSIRNAESKIIINGKMTSLSLSLVGQTSFEPWLGFSVGNGRVRFDKIICTAFSQPTCRIYLVKQPEKPQKAKEERK